VICAAVVPAAGRGERLGPGDPKALREVAGAPLLVHALHALDAGAPAVAGVVPAPPDHLGLVVAELRAAALASRWHVVPGGATRQESVAHGLLALPADAEVVLVHDAARACVPPDLVRRVVTAVEAGADAVVPVVPVADTLKRVDTDGVVDGTVDRSRLRQAQTPQGFRRAALEAAYAAADGWPATDDAGLVEHVGGRVVVVDGDPRAFKVTGPLDLLLAERLLQRS